jgi:hypothetical protein
MKLLLLEAGYGRVYRFRYPRFQVDETPQVLYLAKYRHRTTGKRHLAGINLNYLSEDEIEELRGALPELLAAPPRQRYDVGMSLIPHIFGKYYRTYLFDNVIPISAETLRKPPTPKMKEKEERRRRWAEMSPEERKAAYIERARKAAETRRARRAEAEREAERLRRREEYD